MATIAEAVVIRSASGDLEAQFAPDEGMLGVSLRHRGDELLGRRGIPLLHPWANRLSADHFAFAGRRARIPAGAAFVPRDDHGLAIHGLVAPAGAWRVQAGATRLRAQLDFTDDPALAAAFPFPHRLTLDIAAGEGALVVSTTLAPTGFDPVPVAFGFHPYLRLPGVPRRAWRIALPARRHAALDLDGIPTGRSVREPAWAGALGDRTFDEAYRDIAPGAAFRLEGGGRRITTRFGHGYPVAQVFAPGDDDVICFEPMTAPVDALVSGIALPSVAPGRTFTASFSIAVEAT